MTARIDQASAPKKGRASRLLPLLPFLFALPLMLLLGARIAEALRQAYEQPFSAAFTDDASVVEALGEKVHLVEGNRENIKLTTPFDLKLAELLCLT